MMSLFSCATSRDTHNAHSIPLQGVVYLTGPYIPFHSWRVVVLKEIIDKFKFLHLFYFLIISVDVF